MKTISTFAVLLLALNLYSQCPGLVIEHISIDRVGHTAVANLYTVNLQAHTTNGTTPSLKLFAKCGEWYYQAWECYNIPHKQYDASRDTLCFFRERFEVYGEWYSGPNCTGAKCLTTPIIGEIVREQQPVKRVGNVLSFSDDIKTAEIINTYGQVIRRYNVRGDMGLDLGRGIYFVKTKGSGVAVTKIVL